MVFIFKRRGVRCRCILNRWDLSGQPLERRNVTDGYREHRGETRSLTGKDLHNVQGLRWRWNRKNRPLQKCRFDELVLEMPKLSKYICIWVYHYEMILCILYTNDNAEVWRRTFMLICLIWLFLLELTIKKYWVSWSMGECLIVHTLLLHELRRWTDIYQWTLCT